MFTLNGDRETFYSIAFSPSDFIIASGSNQSVKLWNSRMGTLINKLDEQESFYSLAFSADGHACLWK